MNHPSMPRHPLISAAELRTALAGTHAPLLLDCGFDLADPAAGERAWAAGHLPGSRHVHLDHDLAGTATGHNGRHPLPSREDFAARAGAWGVAPGVHVVVYDNHFGTYAARAWWMLRWLGHPDVQLLDGGKAAWVASGGPLETSASTPRRAPPYPASASTMPVIAVAGLLDGLAHQTVLDARAPERFRGDVETLDPVAGHIPGARNRLFKHNLDATGQFKPAAELRAEFEAMALPADVVHSCGSGVTACHNLLAMEVAGLGTGTLYVGSWSEWCADPTRPVERG